MPYLPPPPPPPGIRWKNPPHHHRQDRVKFPSYLNLLDIANAENEQPKVLNTLLAMMNIFTINKNSNPLPAVPLECFRGNKIFYLSYIKHQTRMRNTKDFIYNIFQNSKIKRLLSLRIHYSRFIQRRPNYVSNSNAFRYRTISNFSMQLLSCVCFM